MSASAAKVIQYAIANLRQWQTATWQDYVALRDDPKLERIRLFFDEGWLWVDMGAEGINHASISDLFTMLFFIWSTQRPEQVFSSLGRCLLEKSPLKAGAPDLVLYLGEDYPRWQPGEPRRIDLHQWLAPNLVGEISDTTLTTDLDEKKKIYASLGISEYWVIDVRGQRVFAFQLQDGKYTECTESVVLQGLPISLLNQALERMNKEANTRVAAWLAQQIASLPTKT
ncbi:Uma2 family endonuclease [Iningainema tapete]|uniref:Uma2 family endonuclease n=1 Tax=Iningainema tapete BLCC-T55 TaxID=2748662 RepID=A0A8J6XJH1_9CYAN|nr:Uma2 family endonuclease [Iningainema tapete]MBD2771921.1 Uma2 family endonuclease [Iningainema tapete BLCC-T55]